MRFAAPLPFRQSRRADCAVATRIERNRGEHGMNFVNFQKEDAAR
jgi:hypothetical protein